MLRFDQGEHAPLAGKRPAVTMGVFDGVHRGHRKIIDVLRETARDSGVPSLAITFSPHPRQALGRAAPPGICDLETRLELLEAAGVDATWVLPFTQDFSRHNAYDFAEAFFHRRLGASAVVLGESAVFGRDRQGTAQLLGEWGKPWGMRVRAVPPLLVNGSVVSSTAIRLAVQAGDLRRARDMLGRPVSVRGLVVHGQGKGHKMGFPTVNLDPYHELRPPPGVYYTLVLIAGVSHPSITNIGRPPTDREIEAGIKDVIIEAHLLDFQGDLYGRTAEIEFFEKKRDAVHFPDVSGLIRQVNLDMREARDWFRINADLLKRG